MGSTVQPVPRAHGAPPASLGDTASRARSTPGQPHPLILLGALLAVTLGAVLLAGWIVGSPALTSLGTGTDTGKANTALALILFGIGLWLLGRSGGRSRVGIGLVLAAAAIGVATGFEYVAGLNLGIDEALFRDPTADGIPGRMAPFSAFSLAALGVGAALAARRRLVPAVVAASVGVIGVGTLNLVNTVFGGEQPRFLAEYTQMHPAVGFAVAVLGFGVLELLGQRSPLRVLGGPSESATMARRVAIATMTLLSIVAWLRVLGEGLGLYHSRFGAAFTLVTSLVWIGIVVVVAAASGRRAEAERTAAQAERDRFFDLSLDLLATLSADGRFVRLNRAWETTLGHHLGELGSRSLLDFVHPDDREATAYELRRQFAEGKTVLHFQNRCRHADGSYRWLEWSSQPGADGGLVYAVARDITLRKQEEERLTQRAASLAVRNEQLADRAVRDSLTGLHNRAYLDAAMARLGARHRRTDDGPMAAILFDLDHFGSFNKQYGHQAGDMVLRTFAELLRRRFRGGDIVARYGGEEFVVLMPGASRDDATRAADEVRGAFAVEVIAFDGAVLSATVSAGAAQLDAGMSIEELLTVADTALVQAKRAGRNTVVAA